MIFLKKRTQEFENSFYSYYYVYQGISRIPWNLSRILEDPWKPKNICLQGYGPPPPGYAPPPQGYAPPPQGYAPPPQSAVMQPTNVPPGLDALLHVSWLSIHIFIVTRSMSYKKCSKKWSSLHVDFLCSHFLFFMMGLV